MDKQEMLAQTKWVAAALGQCVRLGAVVIGIAFRLGAVHAAWTGDYPQAIFWWIVAESFKRAVEKGEF